MFRESNQQRAGDRQSATKCCCGVVFLKGWCLELCLFLGSDISVPMPVAVDSSDSSCGSQKQYFIRICSTLPVPRSDQRKMGDMTTRPEVPVPYYLKYASK